MRGHCWWICWNHRPQGLALAVSQFSLHICQQPLLALLLFSFQSEFFLDLQACTWSLFYVFPYLLYLSPITESPALSLVGHLWGWDYILYTLLCCIPSAYIEGHNFICGIIEVTALAKQLRAHLLLLVIQDYLGPLCGPLLMFAYSQWRSEGSYSTLSPSRFLRYNYEASSIDPL